MLEKSLQFGGLLGGIRGAEGFSDLSGAFLGLSGQPAPSWASDRLGADEPLAPFQHVSATGHGVADRARG